jgi:hypothetical protein
MAEPNALDVDCNMIKHTDFENNDEGKSKLSALIRAGKIGIAGNMTLRIYGTLQCRSGIRMQRKNRVFFSSEHEAIAAGYRPCAHCMRDAFIKWKRSIKSENSS